MSKAVKNTPMDRLEQYQKLSDDAAPPGAAILLHVNHIYRGAIKKWGVEAQLGQAIEECAELIVAIRHARRGRCGDAEVAEEIADVEIMIGQLREIIDNQIIDEIKNRKLARLASLLRR